MDNKTHVLYNIKKGENCMDMTKKINEVIDYIEAHLIEKICYETLAQIACCSVYNLQRIFSAFTNISISDYIRCRRMALAMMDVQYSDMNILDISVKYGYDSPDSFSRAFKIIYHMTPTDMRKEKPKIIPFGRINVSSEIKNSATFQDVVFQTMEDMVGGISVKIVKTGNLEFIGKRYDNGISQIAAVWDKAHRSGLTDQLYQMQQNFRDFGIFIDDRDYMIGIEKPATTINYEGYDNLFVPESLWAVAYGRFGNENINAECCWKMIDQYLDNTIYVIRNDVPVIEKFPDGGEPLDQTYMLMRPIRVQSND